MSREIRCDVAIAGGGLAGGLIALALAARRPELRVLLVEGGATLGGNHIWSFFATDVAPDDDWLVEPLIAHRWKAYDVRFPAHARTLDAAYRSVTSERLDAVLRARLAPDAVLTGCAARAVAPHWLVLDDGRRIAARGVIDARGAADLAALDLGWQKFLGQELVLAAPHGLVRPIVMDATVDQRDGYRFVYCLPFAPDRLFVEDTYYSDAPALDEAALAGRIGEYSARQGWRIVDVARSETGVLPVAMGGDFEAYWQSGGAGVAKAGMRAALFHPTTGYSLPDAVRTATLVAGLPSLAGEALHAALHDHARRTWRARGFYRMLGRMMFRAAGTADRYRILERFYRLDAGLIGRFYAGRSTASDKLRLLSGKPPVPIGRALRALISPG